MPPLTAVGLSCSSGATSVPTSPALPVRSVACEPPRRLDTVQFGKIKAADPLQLVGERGRAEIVGQVVEPPLIFILEVQQGAYRLVPALRSRPAVVRPSVPHLRLLRLVALAIAPLSLRVGQRHGLLHTVT